MSTREAIRWFKQTFHEQLVAAAANTPYGVDLLCAIAYQETGSIWGPMIGKLSIQDIALLSVGDTLDTPNRSAFPKNKQALLAAPNGAAMFAIARECLVQMAKHVRGYDGAVRNPNKFCHGFGIFQFDLQHFPKNQDYFLQKRWANLDECFARCISELNNAKNRQGWKSKPVLSDTEKVFVAIAYNRGSANLAKGFKQGHQSPDGRFYGENIFDYLRLAQATPATTDRGAEEETLPAFAPIPAPTPVFPGKRLLKVKTTASGLNLRREPKVPRDNPKANVSVNLPGGHLVSWISGKSADKWMEVETSLNGAFFKGFAATEYLEPVKDAGTGLDVMQPETLAPNTGIVEVYMPKSTGTIIKRTQPANAHSLNEPGQPKRNASDDPAALRTSLTAIIDWLSVEKLTHKRYQPVNNSTFCNVYAHDYCLLAGVYFPRVWWTQSAIVKLARNERVDILLGNTIEEIRANSLFRWLRDFGQHFGWRQTGNLTSLQNAANIGGVALIIARRTEDGRSGHVTVVVAESAAKTAKRDAAGAVILPVQSQAGVRNIKMDKGTNAWWLGSQFAEHAFWIHA